MSFDDRCIIIRGGMAGGLDEHSTDPQAPLAIDAAIAPRATLGGRYQVRERIGGGGMGSVWRVHDERTGEDVALKVLPPRAGADALARFRREVTLARRIAHPNVCRVFDLGDPDGLHVLTMELIEGESLRARLARGSLPWPEARRLIDDLLAGLAAVHAAGVVHRDIKPENILIASGVRAVVVDFGLAWAPATQATTAPEVGTPQYMAPEQLAGESVDARSDVFAAGLLIHEILDGRPPFEGATTALVASAILRDPPRPLEGKDLPAGVRAAVAQVVARSLGRDRSTRQADAGELHSEWLAATAGAPAAGLRARWGVAIAVGVATLALIGAVAALVIVARAGDRDGLVGEAAMALAPARPPAMPLAIVPCRNLTGDPAREPLGVALTEALASSLAPLPGLGLVAPRGAGWQLDCRVTRLDAMLRVTLAFRDPEGRATPPLTFDDEPRETTSLVSRAARRAIDEARLIAADHRRRWRARTAATVPVARDRLFAYYDLIGDALRSAAIEPGQRLLDEALAADPTYVPALVEHGWLHVMRAWRGGGDPARAQAMADLDRAIALAPRDPEAHGVRCVAGQIAIVARASDPEDAQIDDAIAECETALALGARPSRVYEALGQLYDLRCDDERAIEALERALAEDRGRAGLLLTHLTDLALQSDRLADADRLSRALVELAEEERREGAQAIGARLGIDPIDGAHVKRAAALLRLGRTAEAHAELLAELAAGHADPRDHKNEAAALRGLQALAAQGVGDAPPGAGDRLAAIEAQWRDEVAADPAAAGAPALAYFFIDPRAALSWLDRAPLTSCQIALWRFGLYRMAGADDLARDAREACRSPHAWTRACLAWMDRRLASPHQGER
jgi:serine/threonine-protein kinase